MRKYLLVLAIVIGLSACSTNSETGYTDLPPSTPTPTPTPAQVTTTPGVGDTAELEAWDVTLVKVTRNLPIKTIKKWHEWNAVPVKGEEAILIDVSAVYRGIGEEPAKSASVSWLFWSFVGTDNVVYADAGIITPSTGQPDQVRIGGKAKDQAVFFVPTAVVKGGTIMVDTGETATADFRIP